MCFGILQGTDSNVAGSDGGDGDAGGPGPPGINVHSSGTVYVAWGQTDCPSTAQTEFIHGGLAASAFRSNIGSGANYLCLPNVPSFYASADPSARQQASVVGVKYVTANEPLQDLDGTGVPCSVCHTIQATQLVIPGRAVCPGGWRVEYIGYLMSSRDTRSETLIADQSDHNFRTEYICVSSAAESAPGSVSNDEAELYHVHLDCMVGASLECSSSSQITCAVCTLNI